MTDYQRLYRRTSITIDILCLVGFPLVLGIAVNYLLGVGMFIFVAIVTGLRRRFLDERTKTLVVGSPDDGDHTAGRTIGAPAGGTAIKLVALTAALATIIAIVSLAVHLISGSAFPIWQVVCVAAIWLGVALVAISHSLTRVSRRGH
jgi:hypothetical protein